jgi:hypothetical protein
MFRQDSAETIALQALSWLAGQEEILPVFLATTGASLTDLSRQAAEPEFLGSVLDFILMDDAWVMAFCQSVSLPYTAPMQARAVLPGGQSLHWT